MTTFDVLDPKTPVCGRYFLEASAGTGKTFAIETIVPRLLLEREDLSLESILIVTFTRAATRELKARIYNNLSLLVEALEKGQGGPPYLQFLHETDNSEKRKEAKRRLEEALLLFEKAQIYTLHGFCLHVLRTFALETGCLVQAQDEEEGGQPQIREYIKDVLRKRETSEILSPAQMRRLMQSNDLESLVDDLLSTLEGRQKIHRYPSAQEEWIEWNRALHGLPKVAKEDLWDDFVLACPRLWGSRQVEAKRLFSWVERGECSFVEWDEMLRAKDSFLQKMKPSSKKRLKHPGALEAIKEQLSNLYERAVDPKIHLLKLAEACRFHYEKGRQDLLHYSPDDFVQSLKDAVKNPRFVSLLRQQYQALIIDEFQDTDPDQWQIVSTLFLEEGAKASVVYLVGDPKQSIYGFRSADVYTYLRAKSCFDKERICHLGTNFRSHPDLVQALNVLFSARMPSNWMLLPLSGESLSVRTMQARPNVSSLIEGEERSRVHFLLQEGADEELMIAQIACEILRLRKERSVPYKQVAILVKDRYQGAKVREGLQRYEIPCRMQGQISLQDAAYYEMRSFLEALDRPSHLSSIKKVAGGGLLGYSAHEIEGSWDNPLLQKLRESFVKMGHKVRDKGIGVVLADFLKTPSRCQGKTIEQELLERKDASLYFSLRQVLQLFLDQKGLDWKNPHRMLRWMEELEEKREAPASPPREEEGEEVVVMTLHKSKGLEFPFVFALALNARYKGKQDYAWIREQEGRKIVAFQEGEEGCLLYQDEVEAEKLRQLYVALTRAKERVYIPYTLLPAPKRGSASPIELFLYALGLPSYSFSRVYEGLENPSLDKIEAEIRAMGSLTSERFSSLVPPSSSSASFEEEELMAPPPCLLTFSEERLLSFSLLAREKEKPLITPLAKQEEIFPLGSETGTLFHAVLERLCKADLHRKMESKEAHDLVRGICKGTSLEERVEDLILLLQEVFEKTIKTSSLSFRLKDIAAESMQTEVEFLYPVSFSVLKGFIDLVFRFQGEYFVLDWKSNFLGPSLEDYHEANLIACMEAHDYFLQSAIYAEAVKRMLALSDIKVSSLQTIYFFLRGRESLVFTPDSTLLDHLPSIAPWKEVE